MQRPQDKVVTVLAFLALMIQGSSLAELHCTAQVQAAAVMAPASAVG